MRIICIGAHPDDCEIAFGGAAAKLSALGQAVKFLSVTNGEAGHHLHPDPALAEIRRREVEEAARRLGISETEVLPNPDGQLVPDLHTRAEIVRQIRRWQADIVVTHRPWDYHPDHRYTAQLVQDSAYLVMVPHVAPETPALHHNPIFLYLEDSFQLPVPFAPDIAVDIEDVWETKLHSLDAHASQFYEWLPWISGHLAQIPTDSAARRQWLGETWSHPISRCSRAALVRRYGSARGQLIRYAEAFQVSEYGRQPSPEELDEMFPL